MKKLQSAVTQRKRKLQKRNAVTKATKESNELSGTMDQQIEAMQNKVSKSNALVET